MKRMLLLSMAWVCCIQLRAQEPYPAGVAVPGIVQAEYFYDVDPGFGNGNTITVTPSQDVKNLLQTVPLSGPALTNGIHRLYIRTLDELGRWSLTASTVFDNFPVPAYPVATTTPNIINMEYFIDTDPGEGNATPVNVMPGVHLANQQVSINLAGLSTATHQLYIRTKDTNGKWSLTAYGVFDNAAQTPYPTTTPPAPISQLEYYLDADPGFGKATPVTVPVTTELSNFQFNVPLNRVEQGLHTIYVRSKGDPYSMSAYAEFLLGSALPLTWLYVKGEVQQQTHIISWATAAESNVSHFTIEHSEDGLHYRSIGEVKANTAYRFIHNQPSAGWNFYRVVEHDYDGSTSRSKTILLLNRGQLVKTMIAPNPFTDRLHIAIAPEENARRIIVYSTNGRQVMEETIAGPQQTFIDLHTVALPAGAYFVKIIYSNKQATYRVIRK